MHKKFVPHDLNHVRLLRQKQNILRDRFISRIVGMSRRTSCIFVAGILSPATLLSHDADVRSDQTYPKIHRLFQDSMLFLHCVPKTMRSKMAQQTRGSGDEALAPVCGTVSGKISV